MAYIKPFSKTVTLSTLGDYTGYTTEYYSGIVRGMYIGASKAMNSSSICAISCTSTGKRLLRIKDPSTNGVFYRPYFKAQTTTGGNMASSSPVPIALAKDRLRINIASSSGAAGGTVTIKWFLEGGF